MFGWRDDDAGLVRAFTDRRDGVSAAPFAGLNLGAHVGDDPTAVARNRAACGPVAPPDGLYLMRVDY